MNNPNPNPYVAYSPDDPRSTEGGAPALDDPYYGIGFGAAVARFWRKTFVYRGRASRGEYWWGVLFCFATTLICSVVAAAADTLVLNVPLDDEGPIHSWATLILTVALFVPFLAASVRRLHDENLRGWWVLLPLALEIGYLGAAGTTMFAASASGAAMGTLTTVLLVVAYLLSQVALFILPPNPAGARFDAPRTPGR
ncbi:DUF805 domain-containing protein [Bifidobacterium avesanii]|uniref:DUF805 domain-containing protein n=1 Tax=Bifidobacterium avesanii TaxID=1798157 RepID=A0A7K3TGR6_9BIFI|nr:DUF805 domain-containing protein [Bifidobacterium avesanii]KAB8293611.1 hypothetical protein DSM100685_0679 [Bifidobacterium avesanii]NEG78252.1 DUF805 domain-containing protein [Bifidobacterium avesanii]